MSSPPLPKSSLLARVLPLTIVGVCVFATALQLARTFVNGDAYFHIQLGEEFLSGWDLQEPGSVTDHATADWTPTQWLGQIGMAQLVRAFGFPGLVFATALAGTAVLLCLYIAARRFSAAPVAALLIPVALVGLAPAVSARPQVLSLILVTALTASWLTARSTRTLPWWIIPGTWCWAMVHGMWISGVLISAVAVLGLALDNRRDWRLILAATSIPLASLLAAGLTPVGTGVYAALVRVGSISAYFREWASPSLTDVSTMAAGLMLVAILISAAKGRGEIPWTRLLLVALAGAWLVYTVRTVSVAAAMLVPLAAAQFATLTPRRPWTRGEVSALAVIIGVAVAASAVTSSRAPADYRSASPAHASIATLPDGTTVLNEWGLGGYDMWRHPTLNIVQHGYGDMFTPTELARNDDMNALNPGWYDHVESVGAQHALLHSSSRLTAALQEHGWRVVVQDGPVPAGAAPSSQRSPLVHLAAPDRSASRGGDPAGEKVSGGS